MGKSWRSKFSKALWAYRTAYKMPIDMMCYQLVYGNTCHLPAELEHKAFWTIKMWNIDIKALEQKGKFRLPNMRNGGKILTTVPSYIKKEPKDGTTSESRSSNSSQEIMYFSLTLTFIYSVMVSFVVSGKALTYYSIPWIMAQSPSSAMMGIHSRPMANVINYSLSQTTRILRKWMSSIFLS
jgi:hypothetical protein